MSIHLIQKQTAKAVDEVLKMELNLGDFINEYPMLDPGSAILRGNVIRKMIENLVSRLKDYDDQLREEDEAGDRSVEVTRILIAQNLRGLERMKDQLDELNKAKQSSKEAGKLSAEREKEALLMQFRNQLKNSDK